MDTQPITIQLPDSVLRQLTQLAAATHQPVESLVAQSVLSNLPPSPDNAPPELQAKLLEMQTLNIEDLRAIAQAQIDPQQFQRHAELLRKNEDNQLPPDERQELATLRQRADHLMLRKAYAWALLRWLGEKVPDPQQLSTR
jgi:hypothetical protein